MSHPRSFTLSASDTPRPEVYQPTTYNQVEMERRGRVNYCRDAALCRRVKSQNVILRNEPRSQKRTLLFWAGSLKTEYHLLAGGGLRSNGFAGVSGVRTHFEWGVGGANPPVVLCHCCANTVRHVETGWTARQYHWLKTQPLSTSRYHDFATLNWPTSIL